MSKKDDKAPEEVTDGTIDLNALDNTTDEDNQPITYILVGPKAGKSITLANTKFEKGEAVLPKNIAKKRHKILTGYNSAYVKGSDLAKQKQKEFEESKKKTKKEDKS